MQTGKQAWWHKGPESRVWGRRLGFYWRCWAGDSRIFSAASGRKLRQGKRHHSKNPGVYGGIFQSERRTAGKGRNFRSHFNPQIILDLFFTLPLPFLCNQVEFEALEVSIKTLLRHKYIVSKESDAQSTLFLVGQKQLLDRHVTCLVEWREWSQYFMLRMQN